MNTLPDYLEHGLKIISVGLNPSIPSAQAGYYFANPRNRFWKALNASRLVDQELEPGRKAMEILLEKYRIGFTDLVKRPTRMGHELRAADYRAGAPLLKEKLVEYQPAIAWFHGVGTWKNYLKYAEGRDTNPVVGLQSLRIGRTRVFVTPNPSPANARYSLEDLISHYNDMVSFQVREAFGVG